MAEEKEGNIGEAEEMEKGLSKKQQQIGLKFLDDRMSTSEGSEVVVTVRTYCG